MSHSLLKVYIHSIINTKDKEPLIIKNVKDTITKYIKSYMFDNGYYVSAIHCMPQHVHLLFTLNKDKSISDTFQNLKGNSSHWINQQNIIKQKFAWQPGYAAFSVSESQLPKVVAYINNQEEHHRKITFEEEYQKFLELYGLDNKSG